MRAAYTMSTLHNHLATTEADRVRLVRIARRHDLHWWWHRASQPGPDHGDRLQPLDDGTVGQLEALSRDDAKARRPSRAGTGRATAGRPPLVLLHVGVSARRRPAPTA
ncbi:hypothetical protein GCM10010400_22700 [Streptomyces aculeolatus]